VRDRGGMCGGSISLSFGAAIGRQRKNNEKSSKRMIFNTTTNQKQVAATEGTTEGRRDEREAWGK